MTLARDAIVCPTIEYLFSPRELEVARELVKGKSNKIISFNLGVTDHAVKRHLTSIFRKLNVADRGSAFSALLTGEIPMLKEEKRRRKYRQRAET